MDFALTMIKSKNFRIVRTRELLDYVTFTAYRLAFFSRWHFAGCLGSCAMQRRDCFKKMRYSFVVKLGSCNELKCFSLD